MKRKNVNIRLLILFLVISSFSFKSDESSVTNDTTFFDGYIFTLDHLLINNVETAIDLEVLMQSGSFYDAPTIQFTFNNDENHFEVQGGILCNGFEGIYEEETSSFSVLSMAVTLSECSSPANYYQSMEETITGLGQTLSISYEIASDQSGFWMWIDENEKLFFTRDVLSVNTFALEDKIQLSPNPIREILRVTSEELEIRNITLFDLTGKQVFYANKDFESLDVSSLKLGIYVCKIQTEKGIVTKKLLKK